VVDAVLHQGACSDTMAGDGRYVMDNNHRYSMALLDFCIEEDVPLIYASSAAVYGASSVFREERGCESPLNVYGYSKLLFDQAVRRRIGEAGAQIAGFRYFNAYGPREWHKGRMARLPGIFFISSARKGVCGRFRARAATATASSAGTSSRSRMW